MRRLYDHNEQARHPHLLEENYFGKLRPNLVYAGAQSNLPGPQNVVHTHPFVELEFIWKGRGHVLLDGAQYPLAPGDLVVYNAGTPHCEFSDADEPMHFYFAAYDKIALPNLPPNHLLAPDAPPLLHTGEMAEDFRQLFSQVLRELERDLDFGYEIALATARIIVMKLFRLLGRSGGNPKDLLRTNKVLEDAVRYIDGHFTGEITLETLAAQCLVSKYYLSHLFTRSMGMSVGRYVLEKRLGMARHLLAATDLSVEQVFLQSGFNDGPYFCRLFKKETGCTPSQYRKNSPAGETPPPDAPNGAARASDAEKQALDAEEQAEKAAPPAEKRTPGATDADAPNAAKKAEKAAPPAEAAP